MLLHEVFASLPAPATLKGLADFLAARVPADSALTLELAPIAGEASAGVSHRAARVAIRVIKIGKISKILQIFGGLVLGCIKTKLQNVV